MAKKLGVRDVKRKLRRIVNTRGYEYVYEHPTYEDETGELVESDSCVYGDRTGAPSCLIGHLLAEVVPDKYRAITRKEWEGYAPHSMIIGDLLTAELEGIFTEEAGRILRHAQDNQDSGMSWGESLDAALKYGS